LEAAGATAAPKPAPAAEAAATASPAPAAPSAPAYSGRDDVECGLRAVGRGMKAVVVERYDALGGVCLNIGCIPSKALLHTASVVDEVKHLPDHGISYGPPQIDLGKLRGFKDGVIKKLTGGLAGMAKARKVQVVTGVGT